MSERARWLGTAAWVLLMTGVQDAQAASSAQAFVDGVNQARVGQGLEPLRPYWDLEDDANAHAGAMAASGRIARFPNLEAVTSGWTVLAEYQAKGNDITQLIRGAMASQRHRDQLMGAYDRIGVGLRSGSSGELYLAVVLMESVE